MAPSPAGLLDASNFRSIADVTAEEWLDGLGLTPDEIPDAVIVEGSWWREARQAWRLDHLEDVRELGFPDILWGRYRGRKVAFSMAYGAARTVEVIYLFGALGSKLAVQIGTCGGLQSHLASGDVILPESVIGRDGVAHLFGDVEIAFADLDAVSRAEALLQARGHTTHRGAHVTFSSLFAETPAMMAGWNQAGLLSVDMETATTLSVASHFGMSALSLLVVWDDLTRGKRFLDPMTDDETAALDRANGSVYEVALALVEQL
jgi:uridine phosphorylase